MKQKLTLILLFVLALSSKGFSQTKEEKLRNLNIQIFYSKLIAEQTTLDGCFISYKGKKTDEKIGEFNVEVLPKNEDISEYVKGYILLLRHPKSGNCRVICQVPSVNTNAFIDALKEYVKTLDSQSLKWLTEETITGGKKYRTVNHRDRPSIEIIDNDDATKLDIVMVYGYYNSL